MARLPNNNPPCPRYEYFRARYLAKKAGGKFSLKNNCKCEGGRSWRHLDCIEANNKRRNEMKRLYDVTRPMGHVKSLARAEIMTEEQWRKAKRPPSSVSWLELSAGASNS